MLVVLCIIITSNNCIVVYLCLLYNCLCFLSSYLEVIFCWRPRLVLLFPFIMMAFTFPEYIYFLVATYYSREYTTRNMVFVQAHVSRTRKSNVVAMIKLVIWLIRTMTTMTFYLVHAICIQCSLKHAQCDTLSSFFVAGRRRTSLGLFRKPCVAWQTAYFNFKHT